METAVEAEKREMYTKQKDRIQKASENLLNKLGPSSKPFILHPPKPRTDADSN